MSTTFESTRPVLTLQNFLLFWHLSQIFVVIGVTFSLAYVPAGQLAASMHVNVDVSKYFPVGQTIHHVSTSIQLVQLGSQSNRPVVLINFPVKLSPVRLERTFGFATVFNTYP